MSEGDKKELSAIRDEIKKFEKENAGFPIEDKKLKERIVKICLRLIEETPNDKISMMETSHIITENFIWDNYGDNLDEAVDIARELELPERYVSGDVFRMWEKMENKFQQYLSG